VTPIHQSDIQPSPLRLPSDTASRKAASNHQHIQFHTEDLTSKMLWLPACRNRYTQPITPSNPISPRQVGAIEAIRQSRWIIAPDWRWWGWDGLQRRRGWRNCSNRIRVQSILIPYNASIAVVPSQSLQWVKQTAFVIEAHRPTSRQGYCRRGTIPIGLPKMLQQSRGATRSNDRANVALPTLPRPGARRATSTQRSATGCFRDRRSPHRRANPNVRQSGLATAANRESLPRVPSSNHD
jgi:hypothetical protein